MNLWISGSSCSSSIIVVVIIVIGIDVIIIGKGSLVDLVEYGGNPVDTARNRSWAHVYVVVGWLLFVVIVVIIEEGSSSNRFPLR